MEPAGWARGLAPKKQAEWFVDCYRMRVDDDYAWGGCNLHGLYDPGHDGDSVAADFLLFCKLAVQARVLPRGWDWAACLDQASGLLGFAFEKSDAQEKYGGENVFSAVMGGRSLRATAELVYGSSCMTGDTGGTEGEEALREEIASEHLSVLLSRRSDLFQDVGGAAAWARLRRALQNVQ